MGKNISSILCVLANAAFVQISQSAGGQQSELVLMDVYDGVVALHYSWQADIETIKNLPQWKIGEEPPLSVADAVKIAKQWLEASEKRGYELFSIDLKRPAGHDPRVETLHPFFYFITFTRPHPGAKDKSEDVVVLFDGKVIDPIVEPMKKK